MRNIFYLVLVAIPLFFAGCKVSKKTSVTIIATNDIHAQIDNFPKLASYIDMVESKKENVIVVDIGDHFSGNPYVDNSPERGKPIIDLMNRVGYDIAVLGNHEFDYGQNVLKKRLSEANFTTICANINSDSSLLGAIKPYHTIDIDGTIINFIGFIEVEKKTGIPSTNPIHLDKIYFSDFTDVAPNYKHLEDNSQALIALSHLGLSSDSTLAMIMPQLDVIIGGHSHSFIEKESIYNNVMLSQADSYLNYAAVITLDFENNKLTKRTYEVVKLDTVSNPNADVELMLKDIYNQDSFKKVVGVAEIKIDGKKNVACLMTDAMAWATESDFAFYNRGGVRRDSIKQGDITLANILSIEPFSNDIYTYSMTAKEIEAFILRGFNKSREYTDYFISKGSYNIIIAADGSVNVEIYNKNGQLLDRDSDKKYKVAITSYVGTIDKELVNANKTGYLITSAMTNYLKEVKSIDYNQNRVEVIVIMEN